MEKNCKYEEEELLEKEFQSQVMNMKQKYGGDSGSGPCQRPYAGRYQAGKRRKRKVCIQGDFPGGQERKKKI